MTPNQNTARQWHLSGIGEAEGRYYVSSWRHGRAATGEPSVVSRTQWYDTATAQAKRYDELMAGEFAPEFAIGDIVSFVNDYGAKFPERRIVGIDTWKTSGGETRYFFEPHDAPWFSVEGSSLIPDADDPVLAVVGGHKIRHQTMPNGENWFLVGLTKTALRTMELAEHYAKHHPVTNDPKPAKASASLTP